nr:hypothetical protein [Tanacetum cinerariifolium]
MKGANMALHRITRHGICDNCALSSYACGDSLLLTPLCCDDIHDVTPRVSSLAGCDSIHPLIIFTKDKTLQTRKYVVKWWWFWFRLLWWQRRRYGGGGDVGVGVEEMMMVSAVDGGDDVCGGVLMKVGQWLGRSDGSDDVDGDEVMKMVRVARRGDGGDDVGCDGGWLGSGRSDTGKSEDVGVGVEEMMMVSAVDGGDDVCGGVVMKVGQWLGRGDRSDDVDGDEVMKMVMVARRGDGGDDVGCGGGWPESGRSDTEKAIGGHGQALSVKIKR